MRFHIMQKKINQSTEEYRAFFETDSIDEAKDFAMRLAFDETNNVYVQDTKRGEIVRLHPIFMAPALRFCAGPVLHFIL